MSQITFDLDNDSYDKFLRGDPLDVLRRRLEAMQCFSEGWD
jgi:hypothetical protein